MNNLNNIAVVGLGYVGLPLAIASAKAGHKVIGIDSNQLIVSNLSNGYTHVQDTNMNDLQNLIDSKIFSVSSEYDQISHCKIIIICVPTPLKDSRQPDLTFLDSAVDSISEFLVPGQLIILESTVAPETTRNYLIPNIYRKSKIKNGDLFFAFSPERIDPGNTYWKLPNTPKLLAGINTESQKMAYDFYSSFISEIIVCESLEIAETAKLLENSFRLLNISFINELAIFCREIGINVTEVIKAASSKPYGYMPFWPSLGVGGHCIPVDPIYLSEKSREIGLPFTSIELAVEINNSLPGYWISEAQKITGSLTQKRILVIGLSYKPNIADVRESPAIKLIEGLKIKGAEVSWHDDIVKAWNGENSSPIDESFDLAILSTNHDYIDLTKLKDVPILNTIGST